MNIAGADSPVRDLTRWNRAGLSRFRYVEGGAAEWLEYLRVCHLLLYARKPGATPHDDPDVWRAAVEAGAFPDGLDIEDAVAAIESTWRQPSPFAHAADSADYRTALRAQYDRIPLDHTAQIARAFARALHILTETLDAYANEGYLATATQAPHLRRLLEFIGFEPRLAASARLPIALTIADDGLRQVIDRGLAVEYIPGDGSPILTFESMDALTVDPGANLLRPDGWNARSDPVPPEQGVFDLSNTEVLTIALGGGLAILRDGDELQGARVTTASKAAGQVTLDRGPGDFEGTMQGTELLLDPGHLFPARPQGTRWLHFTSPPDSYVGQAVSLSTDSTHLDVLTWNLDLEPALPGNVFAARTTPPAGGVRFLSMTREETLDTALNSIESLGSIVGFIFGGTTTVLELRGRDLRISTNPPAGLVNVFPVVRKVVPDDPDKPIEDQLPVLGPYVTPEDAEPIGELDHLAPGLIHVDTGLPDGVAVGDPVALAFADGKVSAALIESIHKDGEDGFAISAALPPGYDVADVSEIALSFGAVSGLVHETRSDEPLFPPADGGAIDLLSDAALDDLLKPGRLLLVAPDPETAGEEDAGAGMALTIATVERDGGSLRLSFEEDLAEVEDLRRGHTVFYGNVPMFGHGKSLPEKVLGSGDGTVFGQVMELPSADIATRPDPGFPGGAAPDIEITASGRKLRLVAGEDEADLMQPAYRIRLNEDGVAEAVFLSRLPTEADGVRLTRFRQGAGEIGNTVPPFAITKPTPKHPAIAELIQPLSPQFGADLQDAEALKSQGSSYFALMDRALSTRDFARLAESATSVWHAHADLIRGAGSQGRPTIALTVVPAGGGSVEPIRDNLSEFLLSRALPGTTLDIRPYSAAPVTGTATINLKAGYAQDVTIADEIRDALWAGFNLEARGLGRTLYVTELTAAIEAHEAVANLIFTLTPAWPPADPPRVITSTGDAIQAVMPAATQTVFIDAPEDIEILWGPGGTP